MKRHVYTVLAGLLVAPLCAGPEPPKTVEPQPIEVHLSNGGLVRLTMMGADLEVITKYGTLKIPFTDIRRIEVGACLTPERKKELTRAIERLGSPAFKCREEAHRDLLAGGRAACIFLQRSALKLSDPEVVQRVKDLTERLITQHRGCLPTREEDVIHTVDFPVIGRIASPTIKTHSTHFGVQVLKLSEIHRIYLPSEFVPREISLNAAQYPQGSDAWLDTEMNVRAGTPLLITAEGNIDLWPPEPGQYPAMPTGNRKHYYGFFPAGALLGRIGEQGKPFLIGEQYKNGAVTEEGRLFVHIVPSPWTNSIGTYKVKIESTMLPPISR
jgi:hypothetical protein